MPQTLTADLDFYERVLDNLHDGVYFVDRDRQITYWNRGAYRITGYSPQEVLGRTCRDNLLMHSDRSGSPQIYVVGVDGLNLSKKTSESYCDRPTWSPAPFNEIAFAARSGPGFDIRVLDLVTGLTKSLTFGEGTNESPAFSPNGRHIVFTSTRSGKTQVFTMARDGKNVRQITKAGNNYEPDWSK